MRELQALPGFVPPSASPTELTFSGPSQQAWSQADQRMVSVHPLEAALADTNTSSSIFTYLRSACNCWSVQDDTYIHEKSVIPTCQSQIKNGPNPSNTLDSFAMNYNCSWRYYPARGSVVYHVYLSARFRLCITRTQERCCCCGKYTPAKVPALKIKGNGFSLYHTQLPWAAAIQWHLSPLIS